MLRHLSGKPFEYLFYCLDIKLKVRLAVRSLSSLVRQFIAQVYQPAPTSAQLNLTALRSLPGKMFGVFFFLYCFNVQNIPIKIVCMHYAIVALGYYLSHQNAHEQFCSASNMQLPDSYSKVVLLIVLLVRPKDVLFQIPVVFFFTLVLSHHIPKICTVGQSF